MGSRPAFAARRRRCGTGDRLDLEREAHRCIRDMVSFSFQVNKNIMTGEGGCLVINDPEEASLAERYRLQGVSRRGSMESTSTCWAANTT